MSTTIEIMSPEGRIVQGHPMIGNPVKDTRTGAVKMQADGVTPRVSYYFAIAIPKNGTTDWRQTEWGQKIAAFATQVWPNGDTARRDFSWKIEDGDSIEPNKKNKRNVDREGFPGNWIIKFSTELGATKCYHVGKYEAYQVIQNQNELKTGDYISVYFSVKSNESLETAGLYVNPLLVSVERAGQQIITESGPDAAAVFGNRAAGVPVQGMPTPAPTPAPAPAPQPAILNAPTPMPTQAGGTPPPAPVIDTVMYQGTEYQVDALRAGGWSEEQINACR